MNIEPGTLNFEQRGRQAIKVRSGAALGVTERSRPVYRGIRRSRFRFVDACFRARAAGAIAAGAGGVGDFSGK